MFVYLKESELYRKIFINKTFKHEPVKILFDKDSPVHKIDDEKLAKMIVDSFPSYLESGKEAPSYAKKEEKKEEKKVSDPIPFPEPVEQPDVHPESETPFVQPEQPVNSEASVNAEPVEPASEDESEEEKEKRRGRKLKLNK